MQKTVREWEDAGFHCLITAPEAGPLRGYVGVPEGHPLYGMSVEQAAVKGLAVRDDPDDYGVTFAGELPADSYAESHGLWWFGFNAQHPESANSLQQTASECDWLAQGLSGIWILSEMEEGEPAPETLCKLLGGPNDGDEVLIADGLDVMIMPFDSPAGYPVWASYIRSEEQYDRFVYDGTEHPSAGFLPDSPPS
jgi:hypothetical protein